MNQLFRIPIVDSLSYNRKSKTGTEPRRSIENRKWVGCLAILLLLMGWVRMVEAQQAAKIPRIGYLGGAAPSANADRREAFRQGLRELGHVEEKNIIIEWRSVEGKLDRLPALAAELVRLKGRHRHGRWKGNPCRQGSDQDDSHRHGAGSRSVGDGFVASLARPGGNITGLSALGPELSGKRLDLLKETVPKLSRAAVLGTSTSPGNAQQLREVELAGGALKVKLQFLDVLDPKDIETAFRAANKGRAEGVLVLSASVFVSRQTQVLDLAQKNRLPAIYYRPDFVEAGGLMSYGVNDTDLYRRAATYVDKILKGAKPADLPVE